MDDIGVVGGGTMGSGIAEVCARSGCDVVVVELSVSAAKAAQDKVEASLHRALNSGRLAESALNDCLQRLRFTTDWDALGDRQLVIEAAPEDEPTKLDIFRRLDAITKPDALLASNTSSIPLVKMGSVTSRAENVVGIHFFNPAPVLPLVEIVASVLTAERTLQSAEDFARRRLGKHTIRSKDRAGFVVNALLIPYLLAAVRMLEAGFAAAADIDNGMVKGCGHPMGPLALIDLIGLDTTAAVANSLYTEFKEPLYAPPPLLQRMVAAGLLGRKVGQGFFGYSQ